ncbi:MAG: response regulator transcription factor [Bacteroidales bacterium]|jgi:DNA-binding response OmpR family regulator|nr:response regulator transcription factor [Bacteroidales bacterium]
MKTHNKTSVLLVEEDVDLRNSISESLNAVDYKVYAAKKSIEGLDFFKKYDIDVCILDIEMTGIDGFALAAQIRILNPDVPMIFLTSKGLLVNILKDFEYGVDDYLTKPFTNEELLLRIKAVMRRVEKKDPFTYTLSGEKINIGRFVFDAKNMLLILDGKEQPLTRKEAALLKVLYDNKNDLVTRKKVLKMIWGNNDYFIGRSMDVFIARLRKYLKADPNVKILTVHGVGFRLVVTEPVEIIHNA